MSGQINECAKELVDSMSKEANTGKPFEVKKYVHMYFKIASEIQRNT